MQFGNTSTLSLSALGQRAKPKREREALEQLIKRFKNVR